MAIRSILYYPNPGLRKEARAVETVDNSVRALIEDMAETMYAAPGVGLAAPQIGESMRIFVIDIAGEDEPSNLHVFINPEITQQDGKQLFCEGCLSFPEISEDIERFATVTVRALDADGKTFELTAEGLLAVAIQHEKDHLDGKLLIDHLGVLKRRIVHRKMLKRQREAS